MNQKGLTTDNKCTEHVESQNLFETIFVVLTENIPRISQKSIFLPMQIGRLRNIYGYKVRIHSKILKVKESHRIY